MGKEMRVGISGDDGFISTYLIDALGSDAVVIDDDVFENEKMLDAALAGCGCLVHLNGHAPKAEMDRNDPEVVAIMRSRALKIANAKNRHQGLHLILIGSLRVHADNLFDPFTGDSTLAPRDAAAEGQLWTEERCLEHAKDSHPVSVLRLSNLHGTPPGGGQGRGFLHEFARQAMTGWIAVQGSGEDIKDLIHISDLISVIIEVAKNPPPTREAHAIGIGCGANIAQLAQSIAQQNGADLQLFAKEVDELWGPVDPREIMCRLEWSPQVGLEEIMTEAVAYAVDNPY
ncbi:MAG: NAD(P)-dependent oxidoreductase [Euryarchaeota archaeon]|nr:NAD(P)-dependent oxidoreductase [Euryarchaeota archaeon]